MKIRFVEAIPELLEEETLYISITRKLAIHWCACGCRNEVVTPFSPTDWELRFYGEYVSLYPSIGNWAFECQSHYWIKKNAVVGAGQRRNGQMETEREADAGAHDYSGVKPPVIQPKSISIERGWSKLLIWVKELISSFMFYLKRKI